ncbi:MAG: 8-oxo-dGTP diphosphatase [Actinomycetota bacterium]|nr:8-oxo-dGTP diphosphatase [Actinomycetota bacterium]
MAPGQGSQTAEVAAVGPVRAGGGVVWRRGAGGGLELIVVHRPKYDDWSLPKGKLHDGEDEATAALREVEEETGLRATLGRELLGSRYLDRFGRDKTVRYWAMTPEDGTAGAGARFIPNDEVDEIRWVTPDQAEALLSYDRDREVVRSFAAG